MGNVQGRFRNAVLDGLLDKRYWDDPPVPNIARAVDALDAEVRASDGAGLQFGDRLAYHSLLHALRKKLGAADEATLAALAGPLDRLDALYRDKLARGWACQLRPMGRVCGVAHASSESRPLLGAGCGADDDGGGKSEEGVRRRGAAARSAGAH